MIDHKLADDNELVRFYMYATRNILTNINSEKIGVYWSDKDTFYQTYQDDDVIVYWGPAN